MSNVLPFIQKNNIYESVNEIDIIKKRFLAESYIDEDSPYSIFKEKHIALQKELKKICEECRNAYQELYQMNDHEITIDFICLPEVEDHGNANLDFSYVINIDILPKFDK